MSKYKLIGQRFLRKYTEANKSPVYAAAVEARKIVESLCDLEWTSIKVKDAQMTYHTEEQIDGKPGLDRNVDIRDSFDAALFCADHAAGQHRAYANAAVYRYTLPDSAIGVTLTALKANVTSDPYNALGARIHIFTNSTGIIPKSCRDVRGEDSSGEVIDDGTTAAGFAPRTSETVSGKEYWYPTSAQCTLSPTDGLVLQKYLFVAVLMESYSTVRGNWLEGCSFISNDVEIETDSEITDFSESILNNAKNVDLESGVAAFSIAKRHVLTRGFWFDVGTVKFIHKFTSGEREYILAIGNGGQSSFCGDGEIITHDFPGVVLWDVSSRTIVKIKHRAAHADRDTFRKGSYMSYVEKLFDYLKNEDLKFFVDGRGTASTLFILDVLTPYTTSPSGTYLFNVYESNGELVWSISNDGVFMSPVGEVPAFITNVFSPAKVISEHSVVSSGAEINDDIFYRNANSKIFYVGESPNFEHNGQFVRVATIKKNDDEFEYLIYGDFTEIKFGLDQPISAPSGFVRYGKHNNEGVLETIFEEVKEDGVPILPKPNNYEDFEVKFLGENSSHQKRFLYSGRFTQIGDDYVNGLAIVVGRAYVLSIIEHEFVYGSRPKITPINYRFDGKFFFDCANDQFIGKLI